MSDKVFKKPTGIVALCWAAFDKAHAKGVTSSADFKAIGIEQGAKPGTAAQQFRAWRQDRGIAAPARTKKEKPAKVVKEKPAKVVKEKAPKVVADKPKRIRPSRAKPKDLVEAPATTADKPTKPLPRKTIAVRPRAERKVAAKKLPSRTV